MTLNLFLIGCFVFRLPAVLNRSTWKGIEEPVLPIHKLRLENMIMYCVFLRDAMDGMTARKIRETSKLSYIYWKGTIDMFWKSLPYARPLSKMDDTRFIL